MICSCLLTMLLFILLLLSLLLSCCWFCCCSLRPVSPHWLGSSSLAPFVSRPRNKSVHFKGSACTKVGDSKRSFAPAVVGVFVGKNVESSIVKFRIFKTCKILTLLHWLLRNWSDLTSSGKPCYSGSYQKGKKSKMGTYKDWPRLHGGSAQTDLSADLDG